METMEKATKKTWDWKSRKPNNMRIINAGPETGFFKWWCTYMTPMVHLTKREIDVMASILKQRYELSKKIPDKDILDSIMLDNTSVQNKIIEECNITLQHFYVIKSSLKEKHVLTDKGVDPMLVPNIKDDNDGVFQFLILFKDPDKK